MVTVLPPLGEKTASTGVLNTFDRIKGATVGQLVAALSNFDPDLPVVMRTYGKADVCPVVEVEQRTLEIATDITRVELRMKKAKRS